MAPCPRVPTAAAARASRSATSAWARSGSTRWRPKSKPIGFVQPKGLVFRFADKRDVADVGQPITDEAGAGNLRPSKAGKSCSRPTNSPSSPAPTSTSPFALTGAVDAFGLKS